MRFCLRNSEAGVNIEGEDLEKAPESKLSVAAQHPNAGDVMSLEEWQDGSLDTLRVCIPV